jgi:putative endonuclease
MSYQVYILQSRKTGRYYCGQTDDLAHHLRQHNDPEYHGSKTTKRFEGPWIAVWSQQCETRSDAMAIERKIKNRGIFRYLEGAQLVRQHREERGLESCSGNGAPARLR